MILFSAGACCALLLLEACGRPALSADGLAEVSRLLREQRHEEALAALDAYATAPSQPELESSSRKLRLVALAGLGRTPAVLAGASELRDQSGEPLDRAFVGRLSGLLFTAGCGLEEVNELVAAMGLGGDEAFGAVLQDQHAWVRAQGEALWPDCPYSHLGCTFRSFVCGYPGPGFLLFDHDYADWCREHGFDPARAPY